MQPGRDRYWNNCKANDLKACVGSGGKSRNLNKADHIGPRDKIYYL